MHILRIALFLVFAMISSGHATVLNVNANGSGEYPHIQAAIAAATDGDTILAAPGTYTGTGNRNIDFGGVDLVLFGAAGPDSTVIDLEGERGFHFHGGETRAAIVQGFTIMNGFHYYWGAGMLIEGSSPSLIDLVLDSNDIDYGDYLGGDGAGIQCNDGYPLLDNVTIQNSSGGGGMHCVGGGLDLRNANFYSNRCINGNGGGLSLANTAAVLMHVVFVDNYVSEGSGGGLYCGGDSVIELSDILFEENETDQHVVGGGNGGGGMACSGCSPTLSDVRFLRNLGSAGGGMACWNSSPTLSNTLFYKNEAWYGHHLNLFNSSPTLSNVTFAETGFEWWNYGLSSIRCTYDSSPILSDVIVAFSHVAGILADDTSYPSLSCCDVFGNEGGNYLGNLPDQTGLNGNISDDPLFCDPPGMTFTLDANSPCLPFNNDCGAQIGAFGLGCGDMTGQVDHASKEFFLLQVYPNPFNPITEIRFSLPAAERVTLAVFDLSGRQVAVLISGEDLAAGHHAITWDAGTAPSGVYLCRLDSGTHRARQKMVLMK